MAGTRPPLRSPRPNVGQVELVMTGRDGAIQTVDAIFVPQTR